MRIRFGQTLFVAAALAATIGAMAPAGVSLGADEPAPAIKYEGKGDRRERLDAMQGKPFDPSLWSNLTGWTGPAVTSESIKDKVVVLVTWSSWYRTSHEVLKSSQALFEKHAGDGLIVVGVHDRKGFDRAGDILTAQGAKFINAMDKDNSLRTALEVDSDPDFYLIDRAGNLRFADVATSSVEPAIEKLLAETPEQAKAAPAPSSKDALSAAVGAPDGKDAGGGSGLGVTTTAAGVKFALPAADAYTQAKWPAANKNKGSISAKDLQGKALPAALGKETWLTAKPDMAGKVVVIDFWATWCPPCRAAMPGVDKLSQQFKDDVVVMGLSDEGADTVKKFLAKSKHSYPQAVDASATLNNALGIQGIPHVIVVSTDGVIRWQGHPGEIAKLTSVVGAAVKADPGVAARRAAEAEANKKK
jgi:thiol-disulfide isomerase/thioredoxin